jgi:membrane protein DedA with SNARE-associated domain
MRFPYPIFVVSVMISTAVWAGAFLFIGLKLGPEVHVLTHPHGRIWLVVVAVCRPGGGRLVVPCARRPPRVC